MPEWAEPMARPQHFRADETDGLPQELAWIKASQKGDSAAFNHLVLKWEKSIYNLSLRMLQNPDEAAETTQEVFFNAYRNIRSFRGQARFSTWLYRIAANHCISRLRRRPAATACSLDELLSPGGPETQLLSQPSHEEECIRVEKQAHINRILGALEPEQRIVVDMKYFREMTFEEISNCLEIPASTIKTRLYSALEIMKNRMAVPPTRPDMEKSS